MALSYDELYLLCEEWQQLVGSQLQHVAQHGDKVYHLHFFGDEKHCLTLDLNPRKPLMVRRASGPKKNKGKKDPVTNFLGAHFVNALLVEVAIASKPNRALKLVFENREGEKKVLFFVCFPHGQQIQLKIEGKEVIRPRQKNKLELEETYFVEPELKKSWEINEGLALELKGTSKTAKKTPDSPAVQIVSKLKKALGKLEETHQKQIDLENEKIQELEAKALELKLKGGAKIGGRLKKLYTEIDKLKRKRVGRDQRKSDLLEQIQVAGEGKMAVAQKSSVEDTDGFRGVKIQVDPVWQVWVGKSAEQNDQLVRLAKPHEIWLHLRDHPGAHGLIRGPKNKDVPEAVTVFACQVVAMLSRSKRKAFAEGDPLDFVLAPRKFIRKPKGAPVGQVIVEREKVRRVAFKLVQYQTL